MPPSNYVPPPFVRSELSAPDPSGVPPTQVTLDSMMKERGHLDVTVSPGVGSFSNAALKTLLAKRDHISEALLVLVNRNLRGDFSASELELHIASRGVGVGKKVDDPTAVRPVTVTDVMARWVGRLGLVPHKAAIIEHFTHNRFD